MLECTQLIGFGVGGSAEEPPSITYIGNVKDDTAQTTYTFTDASIGGPGLIVVGVHCDAGSARTISGTPTIGGVSATVHCNTSAANVFAIISARITSGTTATISITMSSSCNNMRVGIWRIQNNASDTPVQSDAGTASTSNPKTTTIAVLTGDCIVAVADNTLSTATFTWTPPMTENYDDNSQSGHGSSGASHTAVSDNASFTVEVSSSSNTNGMSVASWR